MIEETPDIGPPAETAGDVLAQRRARRSDPAVMRRADAAEAAVRNLEIHLAALEQRLEEVGRERMRIAEQLAQRESDVSEIKQREYTAQQLRVEAEGRSERIQREMRGEIEALSARLQETDKHVRELDAELTRLRERDARLTPIVHELIEVAAGLRTGFERELAAVREELQQQVTWERETYVRELTAMGNRMEDLRFELTRTADDLRAQLAVEASDTALLQHTTEPESDREETHRREMADALVAAVERLRARVAEVKAVEEEQAVEALAADVTAAVEPAIQTRAVERPATETRFAAEPAVEPQAFEAPAPEDPAPEDPAPEAPVAEAAVAQEPAIQTPTLERLALESYVVEDAVAESFVVEDPVTEEPAPEEPVAEAPVEEPVVEKPSIEEPPFQGYIAGTSPVEATPPAYRAPAPREHVADRPDQDVVLGVETTAPASPAADALPTHQATAAQDSTAARPEAEVAMAETLAPPQEESEQEAVTEPTPVTDDLGKRDIVTHRVVTSEPVALHPRSLSVPKRRTSWLAPTIRRLAAQRDAKLAAELVIELIPAQAHIVDSPVSYEIDIQELGTFYVTLDPGHATISRESAGAADFSLEGSVAAFSELAAGGASRKQKGLRIRKGRRSARRFLKLRRRPIALADLALGEVDVWPGLLLLAMAEAIDPSWTTGRRFELAFEIQGNPGLIIYIRVCDGETLHVSRTPSGQPVATVTVGGHALICLLAGVPAPAGQTPLVIGDATSVDMFLQWTARAQGLSLASA